jgi:hypothetical protein
VEHDAVGVKIKSISAGSSAPMSTLLSFDATEFEADTSKLLQVGFSQGRSDGHYLVIGRLDDQPTQPVAGMENVYLERDDQCWGGYGGIEKVVLDRNSLTVRLTREMAACMGGYEELRVNFELHDGEFSRVADALKTVLLGYEERLSIHEHRSD